MQREKDQYKKIGKELVEEYVSDQIDLIMFDLLTEETHLNFMVNLCRKHDVDRWKLVDLIKDCIIEELSEDEYLEDDSIQELIEKDPELIPIYELTNRIKLKNKKIVLFKIFSEYKCIFEDIHFIAKLDAINLYLKPLVLDMNFFNGETHDKINGKK